MAGVAELVLVGLDDLARDLVRPAGVVLDGGDGEGGIGALGPSKGFAWKNDQTRSQMKGDKTRHRCPTPRARRARRGTCPSEAQAC